MIKNIKLFTAIGMIGLGITSCSDYLDVNDNPNKPLMENIAPEQLLTAAQTNSYRLITGDNKNLETSIGTECMNQFGNVMMNSWAGNPRNTTNPYSNEYKSIMTTTFYDKIWDWGYRSITNFQNIIDYNSTDYDNHKAIAKILKSFYMQSIVDFYGDCPYSEAFVGAKKITPKYDDDKEIYRNLIVELNSAISLIQNANNSDRAVGVEDAMMKGDMQKWMRFANTIKLRILLRQSTLTDTETTNYLNTELAKIATADFLIEDVKINPGYSASNADAQNPFYATYGYLNTGAATTLRDYLTASKYAATNLNSPADPRRGRLFTLVSGNVVGVQQGEDSSTSPATVSLLGPAIVPTTTSTGSAQDGYIMTLSESKFLLAEAAVRYPGIFGSVNAQTLFNEGVTSSFTRLGATIGTYLTAIDNTPGKGWTGTTNKIEAIMYQKWIALMHVTAHESWFDYVKTGFPKVDMPLGNSNGKPNRLLYPNSEIIGNSTNVPVQTAQTAFSTAPFWKKTI